MEEKGKVVKVEGETILVELTKTSACKGCAMHSTCYALGTEQPLLKMRNTVSAKEGDVVYITTRGNPIVLAMLIFLLPIIVLIITVKVALSFSLSPPVAILLGFVVFGVAFFLLHLLDKSSFAKKYYTPIITRKEE